MDYMDCEAKLSELMAPEHKSTANLIIFLKDKAPESTTDWKKYWKDLKEDMKSLSLYCCEYQRHGSRESLPARFFLAKCTESLRTMILEKVGKGEVTEDHIKVAIEKLQAKQASAEASKQASSSLGPRKAAVMLTQPRPQRQDTLRSSSQKPQQKGLIFLDKWWKIKKNTKNDQK